jgi:hypothetical protein
MVKDSRHGPLDVDDWSLKAWKCPSRGFYRVGLGLFDAETKSSRFQWRSRAVGRIAQESDGEVTDTPGIVENAEHFGAKFNHTICISLESPRMPHLLSYQ